MARWSAPGSEDPAPRAGGVVGGSSCFSGWLRSRLCTRSSVWTAVRARLRDIGQLTREGSASGIHQRPACAARCASLSLNSGCTSQCALWLRGSQAIGCASCRCMTGRALFGKATCSQPDCRQAVSQGVLQLLPMPWQRLPRPRRSRSAPATYVLVQLPDLQPARHVGCVRGHKHPGVRVKRALQQVHAALHARAQRSRRSWHACATGSLRVRPVPPRRCRCSSPHHHNVRLPRCLLAP